jgi:hypothetical protein
MFNGRQVFTSTGFPAAPPFATINATAQVMVNDYNNGADQMFPAGAAAVRINSVNSDTTGGNFSSLNVTQLNNHEHTGGLAQQVLTCRNSAGANDFVINHTVITETNSNGADAVDAIWYNSWSPCINFQSTPDATGAIHSYLGGFQRIGELNYGNGWKDFGFVDDRPLSSHIVCGLELFPDWLPGSTGATTYNKFNVQWGLAMGGASPGSNGISPKHWTGFLGCQNGIQGGGIWFNLHGGDSAPNAPAVGINFQNHYKTGINFAGATGGSPTAGGGGTPATIDPDRSGLQSAITLAPGQAVCFSPSTGPGTGAYIEFSGGHLRATVNGGITWAVIV